MINGDHLFAPIAAKCLTAGTGAAADYDDNNDDDDDDERLNSYIILVQATSCHDVWLSDTYCISYRILLPSGD